MYEKTPPHGLDHWPSIFCISVDLIFNEGNWRKLFATVGGFFHRLPLDVSKMSFFEYDLQILMNFAELFKSTPIPSGARYMIILSRAHSIHFFDQAIDQKNKPNPSNHIRGPKINFTRSVLGNGIKDH